ncbi:hypothetical protein V3C10_16985 [[Clostridium] symbiosum]|uniref:hypothetical protein n=1 Tax=Clostridium symbiosum TaxID=1512 RepID=UPI001D071823|nr:hypothetical protein [[Clostridium] symbiosum]MCB6607510.1 hypothetical protein [[Clostridium] symbiosum]MCB6930744.1 hypothetical protein [[Clostridium] symbiosum]
MARAIKTGINFFIIDSVLSFFVVWITRVITAQTEATDGEQPEKEIRDKQRDYDSQASPSAGSSVLKKRAKLWSERETVCRYGCIAECGRAVTPVTIQDRGRKNKGIPGNRNGKPMRKTNILYRNVILVFPHRFLYNRAMMIIRKNWNGSLWFPPAGQ